MQKKEGSFTVRTFECQPNAEIHIPALMQHLQELAAAHAGELGWGFRDMQKIESYWVLVNFKIQIDRLPRWKETIRLLTWPSGHDLLKAFREFIGRDEKGEDLFRAGSEWMILSREDNRPRDLKECGFEMPLAGGRVMAEMQRLTPGGEYVEAGSITIPYSSIDLNGHVNNTEYIRWGLDAVRRTVSRDIRVRSLQITYLSEVFENEEMDLFVRQEGSETISLQGKKGPEEKVVYLMEISTSTPD